MKLRTGYVSNSSSSSFVVNFEDKREELRKERKKKLENIFSLENNIVSLHDEIINNSKNNKNS